MSRTNHKYFSPGIFATVLILYAILLLSQLSHGLASYDAHGIIRVVGALLDRHEILISRPPGHPTTEFYLYGAIGWIFKHGFGVPFGESLYLLLQCAAALLTLTVFYEMLCRLGVIPWRASFAAVCLALSPQFFAHAIDGEEFILALLFVLLALRLLLIAPDAPLKSGRLALSSFCFALATGCRPEIVFASLIYPLFFLLHPRLGGKHFAGTFLFLGCAILLVWLPVFYFSGVHAPYQVGMSLREALLGGGYKLLFQCFGLPVFLLICGLLFVALRQWPERLRTPFPQNFIFATSCLLPVVFFVLFFRYATKPAYVLVTFPFLLLLALNYADALLFSLGALTLLSFFISADIFKERHFTGPYLTSGSYLQIVGKKPYYKLGYIQELDRQSAGRSTVVIGDAWPWDYAYQIAHGSLAAHTERLFDQNTIAILLQRENASVLLSPDAAYRSEVLEYYRTQGYLLKMDRALYRTLFARYDINAAFLDSVTIDGLSFQLFAADPTAPR